MDSRQRHQSTYRTAAAWSPARPSGIRADLGESLISGALTACAILGADYVMAGSWADFGSCLFVVSGSVAAFWLRLRWLARRSTLPELASDPRPRERLILVNAKQAPDMQQAERRSDFELFVIGCAESTSLRHWEASLGREQYESFRDSLLRLGWAAWRSERNPRAGWDLTAEPEEILRALE